MVRAGAAQGGVGLGRLLHEEGWRVVFRGGTSRPAFAPRYASEGDVPLSFYERAFEALQGA